MLRVARGLGLRLLGLRRWSVMGSRFLRLLDFRRGGRTVAARLRARRKERRGVDRSPVGFGLLREPLTPRWDVSRLRRHRVLWPQLLGRPLVLRLLLGRGLRQRGRNVGDSTGAGIALRQQRDGHLAVAVGVLVAGFLDVVAVVVVLVERQRGVDARVGVGGSAVLGLAVLVAVLVGR